MAATPRSRRPYAPRVPMAQRREQLMDAALRVIARDGYPGVSIDAIAREAGVTRPVVYGAFDGVGRLLGALLDRTQARALQQLLGALPLDGSVADTAEFVGVTARRWIDLITDDPVTWRPILLAQAGTPPEVAVRIDEGRERVRQQLQALIAPIVAEGTDPRLDAEVLSHALLGMAEYFGRLLLEHPDRLDGDRLIPTLQAIATLAEAPKA